MKDVIASYSFDMVVLTGRYSTKSNYITSYSVFLHILSIQLQHRGIVTLSIDNFIYSLYSLLHPYQQGLVTDPSNLK